MSPKISEATKARFLDKILVTPDGCWEWQGTLNASGYGRFKYKGESWGAHRFSLVLFRGQSIKKPSSKSKSNTPLVCCHRCDNPPCVNPDHLFMASQSKNMIDMFQKGRHPLTLGSGENNIQAKLTDADVVAIRKLAKIKALTNKDIACLYQVSDSQIGRIVRNQQR